MLYTPKSLWDEASSRFESPESVKFPVFFPLNREIQVDTG